MISRVFSGTGIALLLAASACAPAAAPSPTVRPADSAPGAAPPKPAATVAPAKPAASPVSSPAPKAEAKPTAKFDSAQWEQIVSAAKREARVVVLGPAGNDTRDGLTLGFRQKYPDIQLDYSGTPAPQLVPKILNEQAAGQYLSDVLVAGTTSIIGVLLPANAIQPILPFVVGPDSSESGKWRGGKFSFSDEAEQHNIVMTAYAKSPFVYNADAASPNDFKSFRDLLDPKWKGKISMLDPRLAGGGQSNVTFWYTTDSLGKEFIRQFFAQGVTLSSDDRQLLDWVARGQYPISVGVGDVETIELIRRGLPIKHVQGEALQEGTYVTPGNGSVAVLTNAPHPNAARVYLNHLLSREGQHEWSRGAGFASFRQDVPRDHVFDFLVPKDDVNYQENYKEPYVRLRQEIQDFLKTVLPS